MHGAPVQQPAHGVHDRGVEDVVSGETVPAREGAEPAAADVAAEAHGGARARGEREGAAGRADGVVELADRQAGSGPRLRASGVDGDAAVGGEVEHGEAASVGGGGGVGEGLVVVVAAARADADAVPAAAAHGGLRVGHLGRRDEGYRPRGVRRRGVAEVTDGGQQEGGVGRGCRGLDEASRDVRGEAGNEFISAGIESQRENVVLLESRMPRVRMRKCKIVAGVLAILVCVSGNYGDGI
jgi:hypothetical protein